MKKWLLLISIISLSIVTTSTSAIGFQMNSSSHFSELDYHSIHTIDIGKGAYTVCVSKTNKNQSEWFYSKNGSYQYFDRDWIAFETKKEVAGLFYPYDSNAYYQSTWTFPVTQSEYNKLAEGCASYGPHYVPQPYSGFGWYLFSIINEGNTIKLKDLKKGWVTPFWWNGIIWVKSLPSYVTFFDTERVSP